MTIALPVESGRPRWGRNACADCVVKAYRTGDSARSGCFTALALPRPGASEGGAQEPRGEAESPTPPLAGGL